MLSTKILILSSNQKENEKGKESSEIQCTKVQVTDFESSETQEQCTQSTRLRHDYNFLSS